MCESDGRLQVVHGKASRDDNQVAREGNGTGGLRAVRRAVKNEQVVLIPNLEGLVNAAELLNGNVGLNLMLETAGPPLETGGLRDIKIGDLHAPFLSGEFASKEARESALADTAFLGNHSNDDGHEPIFSLPLSC
jgi:hypothetical protein